MPKKRRPFLIAPPESTEKIILEMKRCADRLSSRHGSQMTSVFRSFHNLLAGKGSQVKGEREGMQILCAGSTSSLWGCSH